METSRIGPQTREAVLLLSLAILGAAFLVTGFAAGWYHAGRRELARSWFARGTTDLRNGHPAGALADLRDALVYARDSLPESEQQDYELELAAALEANQRFEEARGYLLDLLERMPGNAQVNLELARLAVHMGDDSDVRAYYSNAISGTWNGTADQVQSNRREAGFELYRYLIGRDDTIAAQSELLAIAANLPTDPALHIQVGELLLNSGQPQQASLQFERALTLDSRDPGAVAGRGLAAFALDDDRSAVRYLNEAIREKSRGGHEQNATAPPSLSDDPQVAEDLSIAQATLNLDPYQPGLTAKESAQRAWEGYQDAVRRLSDCAKTLHVSIPAAAPSPAPATGFSRPSSDLATLYAQTLNPKNAVRESELIDNPPRFDQVLGLAFAMDAASTANCGASARPEDAAWARIAQRKNGSSHP